jgi:hypothetical protein
MILLAVFAAALAAQPPKLDDVRLTLAQAFALKTRMGDAAFAAEVDAVKGRLRDRTSSTTACATPAETAAAGRLELVRRAPDPQAAARSQEAAKAALAQRETLRPRYLSGEPAPAPYGLVSRMAERAKTETNPRLAELYRRMAEDQFSRIDSISLRRFFGPGIHTAWEKGLDDAAQAYVDAVIESEWCGQNIGNAAWLKGDLRAHGWYVISTYGADADRAAWSIVQHANHDIAFQEEVLAMLEPLWRAGETKGQNYAYLYDQIADARKRPARFDVPGKCTGPGAWTLDPLEDAATTEAWRAKTGLPPLAQYVIAQGRSCVASP